MHVAGTDNEVDSLRGEPGGHGLVALVPGAIGVELEDLGGDPGPLCPRERPGTRPVGGDRPNRQAGVDERLQVRTLAAHEHADHDSTILPITRSSPGSGTTAQ